jgi:hypothetical protein
MLKMIYSKTNPNIKYSTFFRLVKEVKFFNSLTGKEYEVVNVEGSIMYFIRKSTTKKWAVDLEGVHKAYLALTDFKTENFRSFVDRRHSPALGLLLHLKLLKK